MSLRPLHALSAVVIASFASVHLLNHLAALAGIDTHLAFMQFVRKAYRQPVVEAVLLACVTFQAASGLSLVVCGWRRRHGLVGSLQLVAGIYLALFLCVHVGAVLFARQVWALDTNFHFAAGGFHVGAFDWFFAPYYFLAVLALGVHIGCAAYWHAPGLRPRRRALLVAVPALASALAGLLIVLALSGAFYPVDIPLSYQVIYLNAMGAR